MVTQGGALGCRIAPFQGEQEMMPPKGAWGCNRCLCTFFRRRFTAMRKAGKIYCFEFGAGLD
jgi:hypothetical protein